MFYGLPSISKTFSHPPPSPAPCFTALTPTHACSTKLSSSSPPKIARVLLADIAKRIQRRSGAEMGADSRQAETFQRDLSDSPRVLGDLEVSLTERPRGVRAEHLGQHASALPTGHAAERCVGGRKDLFPTQVRLVLAALEPCVCCCRLASKRRRGEARSWKRPHDR